ncbi:MAG: sulfite oxidase [Terriglobia bacterium]|jgi:DMSO/TMAO reductase YedYZ molybdopterin-dependent catalytic subunit
MPLLARRTFLKTVSLAGLRLPGLDRLAYAVENSGRPLQSSSELTRWREMPFAELNQWITPVDRFLVRGHLGVVPQLDVRDWKLVVEGLVERRLELAYPELVRRPRVTKVATFECAGNLPGGGMVSNGEWTGISLSALLMEAGIKPGAVEVILDGADYGLDEGENVPLCYSRSMPVRQALEPGILLAYKMNGENLNAQHGFPLRAVVPGWYANAHVKWLHRIEVTDRPFLPFYMSKRYYTAKRDVITGEPVITPVTEMALKSQIARPIDGEILKLAPYTIKGAAWTGRGQVEKVEVSVDGGQSWEAAVLGKERALCAWVLWEYAWRSPEIGEHTILVRAFDDKGKTQPVVEDRDRINNYVNNWIHQVHVTVAMHGSK